MRQAQQSRRQALYAPNVSCIHLRKRKHLVTKLYASKLADRQARSSRKLNGRLLYQAYSVVDDSVSLPIRLGSGIYWFTRILLVTSRPLASLFVYAYFHMHVSAFPPHIYNFVISTISYTFSSVIYKFSSNFT